ncbi:MAG TPA: hypothetical protein VN802_02540 [Stellaceae bacterium]|nr:hypothetical protein [Stellaceae bacterium]
MTGTASDKRLSDDAYGFMKSLIGMKAALTVMDFASKETELRYRSFYPVGEMLIGIRFHDMNPTGPQMRLGRSLKIMDGKIVAEPRANIMFTPPLVPHHSEYGYGFWHVNDEQEMVLNFKLSETRIVTVLAEGFPKRGRHDRFAWYCLKCLNPLYMREVETGRVGLPGFYAVEDDAFKTFNGDLALRTCVECGTVHPPAYSIFPWNDTPEEKAARALW